MNEKGSMIMTENTDEPQAESPELVETPTTPAEIIAQVLTETRDSEQDDNQIANQILSALRDAGCDVGGQSTAPAD